MFFRVGHTRVCQFPVATLGTAGQAGTLEPIVRPARPVFIGGLTTGDQLLLLLFSQLQRLGSSFLGIPGWRTIGFGGEKTQHGFNELIVSGYRHGRFLVIPAFSRISGRV
ncbi:hypothetical protein D3C71_1638130 [compost metagenome]